MSTSRTLASSVSTSPYPRYEEYKDSGVEWLGEIPNHWEKGKLKYLARLETGTTPPKSNRSNYEGGRVPWVKPDDLEGKQVISDSDEKLTKEGLEKARLIPAGSVLVCCIGSIGEVGIAGVALTTNQQINAVIFDEKGGVDSDFGLYALMASKQEHQRRAESNVVSIISKSEQSNIYFPVPPLNEQRAIAEYLDRETERIDALIEKKEQLIDLLEEKRTALISRIVTQGLDSDVEMQDSGVEWLGEIPAGWDVIRLRWLTESIEQGWSPNAEEREAAEDEWGVITLSAVKNGSFYPEEHKTLPKDTEPKPNYEIQSGDFLLTRANTPELVGDVCLVRETRDKLMMSDLVYRLSLRHDLVDGRFLMYWMISRNGRHQVERSARGSSKSMVKVSQGHIKSWIAALPPIDEQRRIADHLDEKSTELDTLFEKVKEAIDHLKEYRTALISAAVTGQIDVREDARKPEMKEADTWDRMVLTMELIRRMRAAEHDSLGRTLLVKMLYLIQHHVRVTGMGFNYRRKDYGLYAPEFRYEVENALQSGDWIQVSEGSEQVRYELREKADSATVQGYFESSWGDVEEQIDEIVSYFHQFDAERAEIVATLYAAWNDLKILGRPHDEIAIIREVRENWHPRKQEIDESRWRKALRWMKEEGLVPSGFGEPTVESQD